jgi:hypothetical protein
MPSYKEIAEEFIPALKPFKHGQSMRASKWCDASGDIIYDIYSYSTRMASVNTEKRQVTYLNVDKYSRTTSRQQSLIRRALTEAGMELPEYALDI